MGKSSKEKMRDMKSEANAGTNNVAEAEEKEQSTKDNAQMKDDATVESAETINNDNTPCQQSAPDSQSVDDAEAEITQADTLNTELAVERDRYMRLAAEYDNFRKRSIKERETTYRDARTDVIIRMLPVYDNLERALKMECSDEAFYKGIEMTMTGLTEILENMDVKVIPSVGEPFDPNRHNAVMTIEDPELGKKIVAEEFQKGFMLGDKVIRFSTVVVAN